MNNKYNRGEIYYILPCPYRQSVGSEQDAGAEGIGRPAVIVSNRKNNEYSPTLEVVFLTTKRKHYLPTHVTVLSTGRRSTALCEQIDTVSIERVSDFCGVCTEAEMAAIDMAMLISLGLHPDYAGNDTVDKPSKATTETNASLQCKLAIANAQLAMMQKMYDDLLNKALNNTRK